MKRLQDFFEEERNREQMISAAQIDGFVKAIPQDGEKIGFDRSNKTNTIRRIVMVTTGLGIIAATLIGFLSWNSNNVDTRTELRRNQAADAGAASSVKALEEQSALLNLDENDPNGLVRKEMTAIPTEGRSSRGNGRTNSKNLTRRGEGGHSVESGKDGDTIATSSNDKDSVSLPIVSSSATLDSPPDQVNVRYVLRTSQKISLVLYDIKGMRIRTFDEVALRNAGEHSSAISMRDTPLGVYFITIAAEKQRVIHKVILSGEEIEKTPGIQSAQVNPGLWIMLE